MKPILRILSYIFLIGTFSSSAFVHAQDKVKELTQENILTIDARTGPPTVPLTIGDETYKFLVELSFGDNAIINAPLAKKHKILNVNVFGLKTSLEGKKLKIKTGGVDVKIEDKFKDKNKLFFWFEQDTFPSYDGIIGAGSFKKFDKVVFLLGESSQPQKIFTASLDSKEDWFIKTPLGEGKRLQALSRFSLHYEYTHTNLILSQSLKDAGKVVTGQNVFNITKAFSTKANLLQARFIEPISLLRGEVSEIKLQVPKSTLASGEDDEITIKATSKKRKAKEPPQIYLGRDYFQDCTSLEFIPQEKRVNLYCDDKG